jgi:hypothetical protein
MMEPQGDLFKAKHGSLLWIRGNRTLLLAVVGLPALIPFLNPQPV